MSQLEEKLLSIYLTLILIRGLVISTKMERTIVIRRDYLHFVKKYNRYEKRHRTIPVHISPAFRVKEGDIVFCG